MASLIGLFITVIIYVFVNYICLSHLFVPYLYACQDEKFLYYNTNQGYKNTPRQVFDKFISLWLTKQYAWYVYFYEYFIKKEEEY